MIFERGGKRKERKEKKGGVGPTVFLPAPKKGGGYSRREREREARGLSLGDTHLRW